MNTTKKEGNGNKLPSPSSLQQHYRRKQRHIAIVFFFSATPSQKKMMTHCCRLLLLKHKENKTHKKTTKKKPREGKELTFKLPLCLLTLVPTPTLLFQTLSHGIFFFSSKRKKKHKKTLPKKKKTIKKKNAEKGGRLLFFSCFCIWDEALFLLSPLHIPSMLSSSPSSSLVSHVSLKLCATQA